MKYLFSAIVGALVALGMVAAVVFALSVTGDDESPPANKPFLDGTSYSCERINSDNGEVYILTQHACRLEFCRERKAETFQQGEMCANQQGN